MNSRDRLVLLYDADCGLCTKTVEKLRKLTLKAELIIVPLQSADCSLLPPGVAHHELMAELHVTDSAGLVYRGADAVIRIIREIPALAWMTPIYRVPGLRVFAKQLYRYVARHRYRLFGQSSDECASDACTVHSNNPHRLTDDTHQTDKGDSL